MKASKIIKTVVPFAQQIRFQKEQHGSLPQSRHLICFKDWTGDMVMEIINSALKLKEMCPDTRGMQMDTLRGNKILVLQEVNQPVLNTAVSKASTMLGASYVNVIDKVVWEQEYMGRVFSQMADAIFVSTSTHMCVQRFSEHSMVPVMCMHSRTHATIQALSTVMTVIENKDTMQGLTVGYLGPPHPVLNSLLLLCPMLGANIKYKCCCDVVPITPLLYKISEEMSTAAHTEMKACTTKEEVFKDASVIIAGPTTTKKDKIKIFTMNIADIIQGNPRDWIFIHMLPRGLEVNNKLFYHDNARTFNMFGNMVYIAAALMTNAVKGVQFY